MAIDKAVDSAALEANLTTIANAIREKAGTSDALAFPAGFAEAIAAIESGGGEVTINGCKVLTGEYVSAEDMAAGTRVAIFSQKMSSVQPIAGLFYSPTSFVYADRPFLSASGSGCYTNNIHTLASQVGYSQSGSQTGQSDGFVVSYTNSYLSGVMVLNSQFAIPAGRTYHWLALYK